MSDLSWKRRLLVIGVLIVVLVLNILLAPGDVTGFAVVTNNDAKVNHVLEDELVQLDAYVGSPVMWRRTVTFDEAVNSVTIDIDKSAISYNVISVADGVEKAVDNKDVVDKGIVVDAKVLDIVQKMDKIIVEYETPAPTLVSKQVGDAYLVTVSSDVHYTNVGASLSIKPGTDMQVFQRRGNHRYVVPSTLLDTDDDDKMDEIRWTVPHLSEEEYEVDLMILNVQSYPMLGGEWKVEFNTTGTADLSIEAFNDTTWSDEWKEGMDLEFLEVNCDGVVQPYEWNETDAVVMKEYNCDGKTSAEVSQVLTTGYHHLRFVYGDVVAYADNFVGDWTLETAVEGSADNLGQYTSTAVNSTQDIHVSYYDATGGDLEHAWQDHTTGAWNLETIDAVTAGQYTAITINSTNGIHISYYEATGKDLKHAWYDPTSDKVWHTEVIYDDGANIVGTFTSITTNSTDDIHVSYYHTAVGDLEHAWQDHATGTWHYETVDAAGGQYTSITINSTNAVHIGYYEGTGKDLKHAWYDEATDKVWHTEIVHDDGANNVGRYSVITTNSTDDVHIAYQDVTGGDLEHAWYDTDAGTWHLETIDAATAGEYSSITINSTNGIHISYYEATGADLKHAWYDPTSDKVWHTEIVHDDGANVVGRYTSITTNSTNDIRISYYDLTGMDLEHAWQDHITGTWTLESPDDGGGDNIGQYTSITTNSTDDIHISYYDASYLDLEHAWQDHITGTWNLETIDAVTAGQFSSITTNSTNGIHISYYESTGKDLKHAWYDPTSDKVWHTEIVHDDGANTVGTYTSIMVNSTDDVHIAYHDTTGKDLEHAWQDHATGTWTLETVHNGVANTIGQYTAIATNSTGDIHISYRDDTASDLLHAWQDHSTGTWNLESIEAVNSVGSHISQTINSTNGIHVSYYASTATDLKHAWYDPTTDKAWHTETVHNDGGNMVGYYTSIATNSTDDIHVSYYDVTGRDLEHAWQDHSTGTWTLETVHDDGVNNVGYYTSITTNSTDDIHISYYDQTGGDLEHAWFQAGIGGDLIKPTVTAINVNDGTLTEADIGLDKLAITIDFSEAMDQAIAPTVGFDPAVATTITNCDGVWTDADTYTRTCDVEDANVESADVDVDVSGAKDLAGNTMDPDTTTGDDKIDIDTIKPTVTLVTPDDGTITEGDVGVHKLNVAIDFSETMSGATAPTVAFDPAVGTTLTNCHGVWTDGDTYTYTCDVEDANVEQADVDVDVSGAKDAVLNTMTADTSTGDNKIDIDTIKPTVTLITISDATITEADAGTEITIDIDFSEQMAGGVAPVITMNGDIIGSGTLTIDGPKSSWTDGDTYRATYDVADVNEEVLDVDVIINTATDTAGNTMAQDTQIDKIDVDTIAPLVPDFNIANDTTKMTENSWTSWWSIVKDDIQLDSYNFRTNATANNAWTNQSWTGIDGTGIIGALVQANVTFNYTILAANGTYSCGEFFVNDTSNNWNHSVDYSAANLGKYNASQCFNVSDLTKPTTNIFGIVNSTTGKTTGDKLTWNGIVKDNVYLDWYKFMTNDSGAWVNNSHWFDVNSSYTSTGYTGNITWNYTLTAQNGTYICGEFYFNDTWNNFNHTAYSFNNSNCLNISDTTKPRTNDFQIVNDTMGLLTGEFVTWSAQVSDNVYLGWYKFRTNDSGAWVNDTHWYDINSSYTPTGYTGNITWNYTITAAVGMYICGEFYVNDTANNWNHSVDYSAANLGKLNNSICFTVTDTVKPTSPDFNIANDTASLIIGDSASWWAVLNDNIGLSAYQFRTNDSGAWVNESWSGALGGIATINQSFNYTVTAAAGTYICGEFYFNDTSNNFNHSIDYSTNTYNNSQCFTIAAPPSTPLDTGGGNAISAAGVGNNFDINTTFIKEILRQGELKQKDVAVTNRDPYKLSVDIKSDSNLVIPEKVSLEIPPYRSVDTKVMLFASEQQAPDVYSGYIEFSSRTRTRTILVILDVMSKNALFDILCSIPQEYKSLVIGRTVKSEINLTNLGDLKPVDVTLEYGVKNIKGDFSINKSETFAVYDNASKIVEITLPLFIKPDQYIFFSKIIYGDGVIATSSDIFTVYPYNNVIYIAGISLLVIAVSGWIIYKRKSKLIFKG